MATQAIVEKRLKIIEKVIAETGYAKKVKIRDYIRGHEEYKDTFHNLSDTRFNEIIQFNKESDVLDLGHIVKGRTVQKDSDGRVIQEWVKSYVDNEFMEVAMQNALSAMKETIKPYKPIFQPKKNFNTQLCNQYTITDFHLGMMAWGEETGDDWDMKIAEETLVSWFEAAIATSPMAEVAVFANIGDFLHWDGLEAVTPSSKHVLDADTRYTKLVRVAIRVIRKIINMLLMKYKNVHVVMAEGNHDLASSVWLRELMSAFYENEPRLTVDDNPDPYYCYTWGDVCLFYHHGHKKRLKQLDSALVGKFKGEFGASKHVYAHTGHLHHEKVMESNLMILEQHRTLAGADAHASRGGWLSGRDAKVITYHRKYGEVGRNTINPDMLK